MTEPLLSWLKLGERPGREIVLGQIAQPWQRGAERIYPNDAEEFRRFDRAGYAKIVLSVHAEPRDAEVSQLTIETRVWVTDSESRRRLGRYWVLVGPFSGVIRCLAMGGLASQLGRPVRREIEGEIDIARSPETVFDVVADERNEPSYNPRLSQVEKLTPGRSAGGRDSVRARPVGEEGSR